MQEADMSNTAVLIDEIESLPPHLAAEVMDFVGYLKHKNRKDEATYPEAGKPAALPRFTKAQIEAAAQSPEIQALVGAIPSTGLPPDITAKDIREMRLAEKYGV
jgi:hypothetical protein